MTDKSVEVTYFNMPFETKHFNESQVVWVVMSTGALACKVTGRFRGRGRYVKAWVNWKGVNAPCPEFKTMSVTEEFAKKHKL